MRILVCGGRDFTAVPWLWRELDRLDKEHGITCVMEGASDDVRGPYRGVDYWAHQWALARGKAAQRFHAEWKRLGRPAGPIRNGVMLADGKPDAVVSFPGGSGTADMVRQARAAGVRVIEVT